VLTYVCMMILRFTIFLVDAIIFFTCVYHLLYHHTSIHCPFSSLFNNHKLNLLYMPEIGHIDQSLFSLILLTDSFIVRSRQKTSNCKYMISNCFFLKFPFITTRTYTRYIQIVNFFFAGQIVNFSYTQHPTKSK
jgi:hypothetical protein